MIKNILVICLTLISFQQINCVLNPKVVCYYENWFVWRTGNGKMTVEDVDSSLCTHIVYAYMGVTPDSEVKIPDEYLMIDKKDLSKFTDNKGHAKALVAIGGWGLSVNIDGMVDTEAERDKFVDSVVTFIKRFGFDGISFDWSRTSWQEDYFDYFVKLLERFHSVFDGKYTIGITVAARPIGFKAEKIDKLVDFISVQTFDYHGSWEKEVGHQAPLNWQISVLREWESAGATPHKLLMTLPLFGHSWILADSQHTEPGAKASGPGRQGPWSQSEGKLSFNEICTGIIKDGNWQLKEDDKENGAAYAVHDRTWVTFESTTTAKNKAKNVTTEGYGGVVVQALANEDFKGLCGSKYPLLHAINEGLNKDDIKERTHPPAGSTTEKPPVTADPKKLCHKVGFVRDPKDCNIYHKCTEFFPGVFTDQQHNCPKDEAFDLKEEKCKDKSQVEGCH